MLLPANIAPGVANGSVTVAYRRWKANRLKVGSRFLTSAGLIEVTSIDEVDPTHITEADAIAAGSRSLEALHKSFRSSGMAERAGLTYRIGLAFAGPDPRVALREAADLTPDEISSITAKLGRLDKASSHGAWTREMLLLIDANPQRRAQDLADILGRIKDEMKIDVRKLKTLGLTQSFEVGYCLSPRGVAYLRAVGETVRDHSVNPAATTPEAIGPKTFDPEKLDPDRTEPG